MAGVSALDWDARTFIATTDGGYLEPFAKPHVLCRIISEAGSRAIAFPIFRLVDEVPHALFSY